MKSQIFAPALAASLLLTALAGLASSAGAATFGVRVVDEVGMPVAGASVCVGLPGNYRQFGALFTDTEGQATVDVPNIPFVVTVSKTRFSGIRISEPARQFTLIKQVTLAEGTPGPRCKAGSTLAESNRSSIQINEIDVTASGSSVQIRAVATGEPTEYRVSESPEFFGAKWQTLTDSVNVPPALAERAVVYLQLRRYQGTNDGWLEAQSDVATVLMPLPGQS